MDLYISIVFHFFSDNHWIGLQSDGSISCRNSNCNDRLTWSDGTSYKLDTNLPEPKITVNVKDTCFTMQSDGEINGISCQYERKAICACSFKSIIF